MKKLFYFLIVIVFFGCETEEQKKQKAQEVVQALISNIQVDNYESIYEYYPSFKNWTGSYYKYNSVDITSTMLKDDGTIEIFANAGGSNQLFFALKKVDGNYKIVRSKGLSAYFNSDLYKYCKKIGCIGSNETDLDIGRICKENEDDFNYLVRKIKNKIEDSFRLENQSLNKAGGYGIPLYVSGDIIVKNYSRFTISAYSYDIYIKFLNSQDKELYKFKYRTNFSDIAFNSSETLHIMQDIDRSYKKVDVELVILNTDFIEDLIGNYAEGIRCSYSDNL
ncbi:hypothetical protein [Winogradskyella vincentii]|uniref:DUF4468 domain-containing protein n=1 Tax=Winogradskyella vincentii TaxID=2877122 RepID=A0ABS7Y0Y8_9FLAO|nr:hypothetical protein [Winogradskyella vincentii]MCA0152909.1 hypothetical protein [Winogradskyella vincentii]